MNSQLRSPGVKMALVGVTLALVTGLFGPDMFAYVVAGALIGGGLLFEFAHRAGAPHSVRLGCLSLALVVPGVYGIWSGLQNGDRTLAEFSAVLLAIVVLFVLSDRLPVDSHIGFLVLFVGSAVYFVVAGALFPALVFGALALAPARSVVEKRRAIS